MLVQQQMAEICLSRGEVRVERECFAEAFLGLGGRILLRVGDAKQRPGIRVAGMLC